ncbi:MAG: BACON domain-containing protein [Candidatus Cryptobacteroides sp.]
MKRIKFLTSIILAALISACSDEVAPVPELTPAQEEYTVPAKGGSCTIAYTIVNPYEGVVPTASSTADWITGYNFEQNGLLKVTVAPNSENGKVTVSRSADVTVSYNYNQGVASFSVKITQKGMNLAPEFEIVSPAEYDFLSKSNSGSIEFSIDSPADGATVNAETDSDWIVLGKVGESSVPFTTTANTDDYEREGEIALKYSWEDSEIVKTVTVRQASGSISFEALKMDGYYYGPTTDGMQSFRFYLSDKGFDENGYAYDGGTYFDVLLFTDKEPEDLYDLSIPEGEFTFVAEAERFTASQFTTDRGYIRNFNDETQYDAAKYESGKLSISKNATGFKVKLDLRFADGRKATAIYDGNCPIENLSGIKPYLKEDMDFSNADFCLCRYYTHRNDVGDNFLMTFTKNESDGTVTTMEIQGWCQPDENGKFGAPRQFIINKTGSALVNALYPSKDQEGRSYIVKQNYKGDPYYGFIVDGTMTVSGSFNNYVFEYDFTTDRGKKVTGKYSGPIRHDKMDISPLSLDCLYEDKALDLSYVTAGKLIYGGGCYTFDPVNYVHTGKEGDWTVELAPSGRHDGITLNFITNDIYDKGLQPGTYEISSKLTPGTLYNGITYIHHGYDGMAGTGYIADFAKDGRNCSWQAAVKGNVTVSVESNGDYSFIIDLEDKAGHKITGSWTGPLTKSKHERKKMTATDDNGVPYETYDPNTVILGY